ncbi:hypothetical protein KI387_028722, partial [Taxus chinensis]
MKAAAYRAKMFPKPATYQFQHFVAASVPDRLHPFRVLLSMVVITRKQAATMVSHACSVPLLESPPSHPVGNPTDTSEVPKIPVGDKEFVKFLDTNPSAVQYYLSHAPDRTPDGQLLIGMPISIATHLAPSPPDNSALPSSSLAPSPNSVASEVLTAQIGFPFVNLGPHVSLPPTTPTSSLSQTAPFITCSLPPIHTSFPSQAPPTFSFPHTYPVASTPYIGHPYSVTSTYSSSIPSQHLAPPLSSGGPWPNPPPFTTTAPSSHPTTDFIKQMMDKMQNLEASILGSRSTLTYEQVCQEPIHPSVPLHSYPPQWELPKFTRFNSKEDPEQHLRSFRHACYLIAHDDALLLRTFPMSLSGPALEWYSALTQHSIFSFNQLAQSFLDHFFINIAKKVVLPRQKGVLRNRSDLSLRYAHTLQTFNRTPRTLSMSLLPELAGAIPVLERFQVEGFIRSMQKQMQSGGKRGFFSKRSVAPQGREKFTLEDMLCFQREPIPTSLLRINSDLISRAVKLFQVILKYTGVDASDRATPLSIPDQIELVTKLYKHTLKRAELRDELFAQISKQTRNNPDRLYLLKAWELMYLCTSAMPPGKDIGVYLSEYVHDVATAANTDLEVQALAMNTWNALKRSVKAGPRRTIPAREEIEALLTNKKLTTIAYFLDDTFEEITFDMTTTVADAVEELAGIIKLSAYNTFSLFECRKVVTGSKSLDHGN